MRKKGAKSSRMEYLDYLHIVRERLRRKKERRTERHRGERGSGINRVREKSKIGSKRQRWWV